MTLLPILSRAAPYYEADLVAPSIGPGAGGAPLLVDTTAHWQSGFRPGYRNNAARAAAIDGAPQVQYSRLPLRS